MDSFLQQALERLRELTRAEAVYVRMRSSNGLLLAGQARALLLNLQPSIALNSPGIETSVFATGEEATVIESATLETSDPLYGQLQAAFVAPILFKNQRVVCWFWRGIMLGPDSSPLRNCRLHAWWGNISASCRR